MRQTLTALLRGFNGECDAAISTLKHSNDSTVLGKIDRAFKFYEQQARTRVEIPWDARLVELKVDEAYLVHENALAKQAEREEQIELRRQEREEEKARREAEEAKEAAERDAEKYEELLAKARKEAAANDQSDEYLEKIRELERRVREAEANRERAISRAQMTRSGHVYVISNIGSFGHNVFKVGMTRRLEPTDRVRELGDASVPFPFDIHAMIFTEDAPGLETAIHRRINARRLNLVNLRREFFTITWEELVCEAEAAAEDIGVTAEIRWTRLAEAEQYRQSVSERANTEQPLRFLEQKRLQKFDSDALANSSAGVDRPNS
ncbi:bacteriophage-like DNA-binding-containing protein [Synechococcus sp. A15-44]|nr:bacteriophage-like DNA-binding-containing protein [Synechococcus sp. A15-44]